MPDAIVIGGGVIGLLSARELRKRGLDVTLVERDQPGRQASWASAGILNASHPRDASPEAALKRRSEALYPSLVADLKEETDIDPEMTHPGDIIPAFTEEHARELRAAAATEPDAVFLEGAALGEAEPVLGPNVIGGLIRPGGQIDNRRLCRALEVAVRRAGVRLVYGAAVTEILRDGDAVRGVRTLEGDILAPVVVNAAGSWSRQIPGCDPVIPVVPQRGEILALDQSAIGLKRVVTKVPDPYLVPRADGRLVVGATRKYTGYNSSFTAGGVHWLLSEAINMVPALADAPIVEIWTGFRPNSLDSRPSIGAGAVKGLYFATGHGPSGIAPAPASAELLADLVTGQTPKVPTAPFDPLRFVGVEMPDPRTWGVRGGLPI
ncbi:MAG: glycine oxidase ThiO [Chloroflexi bacterium]|nr:glycine oxidase ThiO [Chloroflexota bacterium]